MDELERPSAMARSTSLSRAVNVARMISSCLLLRRCSLELLVVDRQPYGRSQPVEQPGVFEQHWVVHQGGDWLGMAANECHRAIGIRRWQHDRLPRLVHVTARGRRPSEKPQLRIAQGAARARVRLQPVQSGLLEAALEAKSVEVTATVANSLSSELSESQHHIWC